MLAYSGTPKEPETLRHYRPQWPGPTPCGRPDTMAGRSGSAGPETTSEAGSRRRGAASSPSVSGSLQETPTAKPPKSKSASFAAALGPMALAAQSSIASTPSEPPRSFAWHDATGVRGSRATSRSSASMPMDRRLVPFAGAWAGDAFAVQLVGDPVRRHPIGIGCENPLHDGGFIRIDRAVTACDLAVVADVAHSVFPEPVHGCVRGGIRFRCKTSVFPDHRIRGIDDRPVRPKGERLTCR